MSADLPRFLADLEALAEDFVSEIDWSDGRNHYGDNEAWEAAARRVREVIAAHTPDAATAPAPGLQAGGDAASGVAQRPEPDAGDVDALADWLGGQVEAGNVTDYTDEQTTWIEVGVDDLAHRIVASDWLAARDAAMRAQGAAAALREAADWTQEYAWQPGDGHMVAEDEQAAYIVGAGDAHDVVSRLLRDRAARIAGQDGGGQ